MNFQFQTHPFRCSPRAFPSIIYASFLPSQPPPPRPHFPYTTYSEALHSHSNITTTTSTPTSFLSSLRYHTPSQPTHLKTYSSNHRPHNGLLHPHPHPHSHPALHRRPPSKQIHGGGLRRPRPDAHLEPRLRMPPGRRGRSRLRGTPLPTPPNFIPSFLPSFGGKVREKKLMVKRSISQSRASIPRSQTPGTSRRCRCSSRLRRKTGR